MYIYIYNEPLPLRQKQQCQCRLFLISWYFRQTPQSVLNWDLIAAKCFFRNISTTHQETYNSQISSKLINFDYISDSHDYDSDHLCENYMVYCMQIHFMAHFIQ